MKRVLCVLVLMHVFAGVGFAETWTATCVKVRDGDSIVIDRPGLDGEIRLHGVDCPEKGKPFAEEASEFTRKMVEGKQIEISPLKKKDRFRRTIARVKIDGKSLEQELVKAGLAWWSPRFAFDDLELERLEWNARLEGRGLWSRFRDARKGLAPTSQQNEPADYGPEDWQEDYDPGPYGPGGR